MTPLAASIVTPGGSDPDASDHVVVPTCPTDVAAIWKGTPTLPDEAAGTDAVNAGASMVSENGAVAALPGQFESCAVTLNVNVPIDDGVPSIVPLALSVTPAGSVPAADQTTEPVPPDTLKEALY